MGLNMKIFDTLGMVTLVTPPSMINPEKISFTLINLKEKEKDQNSAKTGTNSTGGGGGCTGYGTYGNTDEKHAKQCSEEEKTENIMLLMPVRLNN
jgi:hypothetical protein